MKQLELPIKIKVKHRGFSQDRIAKLSKKQLDAYHGHDHGAIERGLAEQWEEENEPRPAVNYGDGALQDLITSASVHGKLPAWFKPQVTARDAALVADVIQWLGTNCGLSFLHSAFKRAGFEFKYEEHASAEKRWNRNWRRRHRRAMEREKRERLAREEEERKEKALAERKRTARRLELEP